MPRLAVATLALLLVTIPARAYEDLGLRLTWDDPAFDTIVGDIHDRLERVDAIEKSEAWQTAPTDSLRIELIQLYRASPLMKHRVLALDLARELRPAARAEQLGLTYAQTFNPWDAKKQLRSWADMDSAGAKVWTREGTFLLHEGLREMDTAMIEEALVAFRRATRSPDATGRAWLGLASTLAATWRYKDLRPVAEHLLELDDRRPGPWLYAGLAHEAAGLTHRACDDFARATVRMGPVTRERFERPGGLVLGESWGPRFNTLRQAPPARGVRGWWTRLVEAEVLFGDPSAQVHGWDTAPGEAYLLFGRPKVMRVHPRGDGLAELVMGTELIHHQDAIARQVRDVVRGMSDLWVWLVPLGSGRDYPLVFTRFTRHGSWVPSEVLDQVIFEEQRKVGAIGLASSVPRPAVRTSTPQVSLLCRGYPAGKQQWRVETWSATRSDRTSDIARVRFTLVDAEGKILDRVSESCDAAHSRSVLRKTLSEISPTARGWVHGLGAVVSSGEVLVTIEVLDSQNRVLAARDAALEFPEGGIRGLYVSELVPCDVYRDGLWNLPIDASYLRHGMVVIPRPEPVLDPGQAELGLYYEVFGAGVNESGQTRLDVDYAIYRVEDFDPYVQGPAYVDGRLRDPVFRVRFPDERTGRGPGGVVVKGTRLPLGELQPGGYVVITTVVDHWARDEITRSLPFVVPGPQAR